MWILYLFELKSVEIGWTQIFVYSFISQPNPTWSYHCSGYLSILSSYPNSIHQHFSSFHRREWERGRERGLRNYFEKHQTSDYHCFVLEAKRRKLKWQSIIKWVQWDWHKYQNLAKYGIVKHTRELYWIIQMDQNLLLKLWK